MIQVLSYSWFPAYSRAHGRKIRATFLGNPRKPMNTPESITSLPERPDDERHRRMVNYSIAMGIRVVCVLLCVFVRGWWLVLPVFGALILPYVAVVLANVTTRRSGIVDAPGQFALGATSSTFGSKTPDEAHR